MQCVAVFVFCSFSHLRCSSCGYDSPQGVGDMEPYSPGSYSSEDTNKALSENYHSSPGEAFFHCSAEPPCIQEEMERPRRHAYRFELFELREFRPHHALTNVLTTKA